MAGCSKPLLHQPVFIPVREFKVLPSDSMGDDHTIQGRYTQRPRPPSPPRQHIRHGTHTNGCCAGSLVYVIKQDYVELAYPPGVKDAQDLGQGLMGGLLLAVVVDHLYLYFTCTCSLLGTNLLGTKQGAAACRPGVAPRGAGGAARAGAGAGDRGRRLYRPPVDFCRGAAGHADGAHRPVREGSLFMSCSESTWR